MVVRDAELVSTVSWVTARILAITSTLNLSNEPSLAMSGVASASFLSQTHRLIIVIEIKHTHSLPDAQPVLTVSGRADLKANSLQTGKHL